MSARSLASLFSPASVALVGASEDPMKWGGWLSRSLLRQPGAPRVHLVNRRGGQLHGRPAYRTLAELPEAPELVVLAIPGDAVPAAVDDALAAGARAIVVIAAGFGELGGDGLRRQQALVRRVGGAGAVLLGPNCLGLFDPGAGLNASGSEMPAGPVAFVGQSGNLALELARVLAAEGLGFSRFAAVGNQAHVTAGDALRSTADHDATRVAAVYVEDPVDGRAFLDAVRAVAAHKPVLILQGGRSARGAEAARSHTGALAGSARVLTAGIREAGGIVVRSLGELVDVARALLGAPRLRGRRVAVMADGGGHGVLAADLLADAGLETATLGPATAAALQPHLPHSRAVNPVDLAGAGEQDIRSFGRIAGVLLDADEVDAVLLSGFFGGYHEYDAGAGAIEAEVAGTLAETAGRAGKPLLVHSMFALEAPPGVAELRRRGVPTYGRVEQAVAALASLAAPPPARVRPAPGARNGGVPAAPTYLDARRLLAAAGVAFPPGELARDDGDAAVAARRLGTAVALKAVAADLLHKTDAGGVALDVAPERAAEAAGALRARVAAARPDVVLDGVFVEAMAAAGGVDLVVGARRDARLGPVVLVGAGGVFVEALDDVAIALAPVDPEHLRSLLRGLAAWPLLAGTRGAPPVDLDAIVRVAVAVGDLLAAHPELDELEVNPLRAGPDGCVALDARAVRAVRAGGGRTTS